MFMVWRFQAGDRPGRRGCDNTALYIIRKLKKAFFPPGGDFFGIIFVMAVSRCAGGDAGTPVMKVGAVKRHSFWLLVVLGVAVWLSRHGQRDHYPPYITPGRNWFRSIKK